MRHKKSILSVVPARGGSKRIKLKNLLRLKSKTLIEYTAKVIKKCDFIDKAVVSTDHSLIKKESMRCGLEVPFIRPKALSGDLISDIEVLKHALKKSEKTFNTAFDIVLMLQPTSPIRTPKQILNCLDYLIQNKLDSCLTVSQTDPKNHPLKQLAIKDNKAAYYDPRGESIIASQMLEPVYQRNGICYAFTRKCILEKEKIITANSSLIVTKKFSINIDTLKDVKLAELHLSGIF